MPWLGLMLRMVLAALVLLVLAAVGLRDAKTSQIPDSLNLALAALGAAAFFVVPEIGWQSRLLGVVAVSGPMLLLALLRPDSLGGGDIKLMAAAGLLLGWQCVLLAATLGILIAGVYAVWLVVARRVELKERFPFGPALCIGIAIAYFAGPEVLRVLLH